MERFAAIYMGIASERGSKFPLAQRHCSLELTHLIGAEQEPESKMASSPFCDYYWVQGSPLPRKRETREGFRI